MRKGIFKRAFSLIAAAAVAVCFSTQSFAAENLTNHTVPAYGDGEYNADLPRVIDDYELLSDSEEQRLEEKAREIIEDYGFDCVVMTMRDYAAYTYGSYNYNYNDILVFAHDYYDFKGYGVGKDHDGIIFVISMYDRSYAFSTCGYGMEAISDSYGVGWFENDLVSLLSDGDYYKCFDRYFDDVYEFVKEANEDKPYSSLHTKRPTGWLTRYALAALVIAIIVTAIVVFVLTRQMKTIMPKPAAKQYLKNYKEKFSQDTYLYSNVSKTAKSSGGSGGHGGGGGHSGMSHGGHSGHF